MDRKFSALGFATLLLAILPMVSAACYVNGAEVPCGDFFATLGAFFIVFIILIVVAVIFWLWMLIDCAKRDFESKVPWILVIVFVGTLGAILYYFIIKRQGTSTVAKAPQESSVQ